MATSDIPQALEAIIDRLSTTTHRGWPTALPPYSLFHKYNPPQTNEQYLSPSQEVRIVQSLAEFFEAISPELCQQWVEIGHPERAKCHRYLLAACEENRLPGYTVQICLADILKESAPAWTVEDDERVFAAAMVEYEAFKREDEVMADVPEGDHSKSAQRDSGFFDDDVSEFELGTPRTERAEMWWHLESGGDEVVDDGEWLARDMGQMDLAAEQAEPVFER